MGTTSPAVVATEYPRRWSSGVTPGTGRTPPSQTTTTICLVSAGQSLSISAGSEVNANTSEGPSPRGVTGTDMPSGSASPASANRPVISTMTGGSSGSLPNSPMSRTVCL